MTNAQVTRLPADAICAIVLASIPALVLEIELRRENPNDFLVVILGTLVVWPLLRFSNREGDAPGSRDQP